MKKRKILKKVYKFYPKNINGLDDAYFKSKEIISNKKRSNKVIKEDYNIFLDILIDFNNSNKNLRVLDRTNFNLSQPSFVLQIDLCINDKTKKVFNLYFSLLIKRFYYNIIEYDLSKKNLKTLSVNDKKSLDGSILFLIDNIKNKLNGKLFCESNLDIIVPEVSFETINNFTARNAFFNNKELIL